MKLNLFSSDGLLPDYLNVDIWTPPNAVLCGDLSRADVPEVWAGRFQRTDLRNLWPWTESSIDEIRAHDGPEHIADKIHFMNEAHRVLKRGGLLDIFVPTTDGRGAWQDPQHVSMWNSNSFFYYCEEFAEWKRFHEAYGITARFRVPNARGDVNVAASAIDCGNTIWSAKVSKLKIVLEAVK